MKNSFREGLAMWNQYWAWDDVKLQQLYFQAMQKAIKIWSLPNFEPCFPVGGKKHKRASELTEQD